ATLVSEARLTGLEASANRQATRTAAQQTLNLYGLGNPEAGELNLGSTSFNAARHAQIASQCYELLLILAEAVAQPIASENAKRQAGEALRILDRAARLRKQPTQAYHRRRAKYLEQRGEKAAADQQRRLANGLVPTEALDFFLLGDEAYEQRDLEQAILYFQK